MKAELKYRKKVQIIKPKVFRSVYELHLDQEIIGTITFPNAMGTLAEVKLLDEEWTLKRVGVAFTSVKSSICAERPNLFMPTKTNPVSRKKTPR